MAMPIELSTEPLQEPVASCDTAISCLARLSVQNGSDARIEALRSIDPAGETVPLSRLVKLAAEFGLQAEWIQLNWQRLKIAVSTHPLLIVRKNTEVVIVTGGGRSGAEEVSVWDPHHDGVVFFVSREDFERAWSGDALIITPEDAGANIFKWQPGREAASDTAGDTSPTPPDTPKQQTPPNPMRAARASKLSPDGRTPRRSLGLRLGFAVTAIVTIASIAVLLAYPGADHVADPSTSPRVASAGDQSRPVNRREAAPSAGAAPTSPVAPTPEAVSTSLTTTSAGQASMPNDAPPLGAPTREARPAPPPADAAPSTVAAPVAQIPLAPVTVTTPVPAAPPAGPVLPATEITALLAHGDALFRKGDLAAARLFYERAADAGDGQSAIRLGETFDPVFLDHAQLRGARGDMGKALAWYRRAEAEFLLEGLEAKQE
jgi:hypothetical protein